MENRQEICRQTLNRLQQELSSTTWRTLSTEFTPERLQVFKEADDGIILDLCDIAHAFVARDNTEWKEADIHPVYGGIISTLFNENRCPLSLQIQFYFKAGETYANKHQLLIALPYYTRTYYLHQQNGAQQNVIKDQIENRLNQAEAWLQADGFLNSLSKSFQLDSVIQQGLPLADQLLAVKLDKVYLQLFYQRFAPYLSQFLEQLNIKLQCSVDEDNELKQFTRLVKGQLLPLAKRLHHHVRWEASLNKWVNDCYTLFDNVLRNRQLTNCQSLQLQVQQHRNHLQQARFQMIRRPAQWYKMWQPLMEAENTFKKLPLNTNTYSQTVKQCVALLCAHLKQFLGQPPCEFAIIASGSLAQNEALPSSDIDLTLLLATDLTDETLILDLRQYSYFKRFINELSRWLHLCHGRWLVKKTSAEKTDSPLYDRHYYHFTRIYTGLRIEPMDLEELQKTIPVIINTPQGLANWITSYCDVPNEFTREQDKILAHSLLNVTTLYSSHTTTENLLAKYQTLLLSSLFSQTNKPTDKFLWKEIPQHAFAHYWLYRWQLYHYQEGTQPRLLQLWAKRQNFSLDNALLFVKDCLRLLTDWAQGIAIFLGEKQLLNNAALFQSLLKLANDNHLATYFVNTWQQSRQHLLQLKYQLEVSLNLSNTWWQSIEMDFEWVIAPLLQRFQAVNTLTPQYLHDIETLNPERLITWLQQNSASTQDYRRFYDLLADTSSATPLLNRYIDALIARNEQPELIKTIIQIPNSTGFRQSERLAYKQLNQDLLNITSTSNNHPSIAATITWYDGNGQIYDRILDKNVIEQIINIDTGSIKKFYHDSLHAVSPIKSGTSQLHVKQLPAQPLMDYAIDILARRLFGFGTPANLLARLTVQSTTYQRCYPVFISQTVGKQNLKSTLANNLRLQIEAANYSALVIFTLLTLAGDGTSRNYMLTEDNTLICVDNEQQFVEPIIKEISLKGLNKVQFRSILFCLEQANQPLDKKILQTFCELKNVYSLLSEWIRQVTQQGDYYLKLFNEDERKSLYTNSTEQQFTPQLLLREGVLGSLLINLNYLQNHLLTILYESKPLPSALDLLVLINPRLGHYYRTAFKEKTPEQRLQAATGAPQASVTSSLAIQASLGIVPTFDEIEKSERYNLVGAKKELMALVNFTPDFSKLITPQSQPDKNRQLIVLKALSLWPHTEISLSHCAILTDELLKTVLAKSTQLKVLKLQACSALTNKALVELAKNHPTLEKLYFTDHPTITAIDDGGLVIKDPLYFPNLKILHLSRCQKLADLRIKAPQLMELKDNSCNLKNKLIIPPFIQIILSNTKTLNTKISLINSDNPSSPLDTIKMLAIGTTYEMTDHHYRFFHGKYAEYPATIGVDFKIETVSINNQLFKIQFWTSTHLEAFSPIVKPHFRSSVAILICAPIESRDKFFRCIERKVSDINSHAPKEIICILMGINLEQRKNNNNAITQDEAITIARENNMAGYFECSAITGEGINEAYLGAFELAVEKLGFWNRLGEPYIPSTNYRANLLLPPDQYLRPASFKPDTNPPIYSNTSSSSHWHHPPKPDDEDDNKSNSAASAATAPSPSR